MKTMRRQAGFTLLELLVASAIVVIIGIGASMVFSQTLENRERVGARAAALADLQRTFVFIQRDLEQIVARPARDELGDLQSALLSDGEGGMEFTRTGWMNPLATRPRGALQRVRYRLEDDRLLREYWDHPDRQAGSEPVSSTLASGVQSLKVQYLFREGNADYVWHDSWPLPVDQEKPPLLRRLPLAVAIEMETTQFGAMKRFFRVVANAHARET
jgi:general secretion pathway protein J